MSDSGPPFIVFILFCIFFKSFNVYYTYVLPIYPKVVACASAHQIRLSLIDPDPNSNPLTLHRAPLPSILLSNVQSLANKVDEIRARVAFLASRKHGSLERGYRRRCSQRVSPRIALTETNIFW
jgi:hypothetical protein